MARPEGRAFVSTRGIVAAALALGAAALCIRLGFWQLDRHRERAERNARIAQAGQFAPLPLTDSARAVLLAPDRYAFRRASARGHFDPAGELVLRGRALDGQPGIHLVTPLRLAGDTVVMVLRGWAPSPDGVTVDRPPLAEPGEREVSGILLAAPPGDPAPAGGPDPQRVTYTRLPMDSLRAGGGAVVPLYLQQLPGAAEPAGALPRRVPLATPGGGPHLGYAVQWFSFAAIALIGLLVVLWKGFRKGRRGGVAGVHLADG